MNEPRFRHQSFEKKFGSIFKICGLRQPIMWSVFITCSQRAEFSGFCYLIVLWCSFILELKSRLVCLTYTNSQLSQSVSYTMQVTLSREIGSLDEGRYWPIVQTGFIATFTPTPFTILCIFPWCLGRKGVIWTL